MLLSEMVRRCDGAIQQHVGLLQNFASHLMFNFMNNIDSFNGITIIQEEFTGKTFV